MKTFCENCHDLKDYYTKDKVMERKIKGMDLSYTGKKAYCCDCNSNVGANDVMDYNLIKLEEAFIAKQKGKNTI